MASKITRENSQWSMLSYGAESAKPVVAMGTGLIHRVGFPLVYVLQGSLGCVSESLSGHMSIGADTWVYVKA